MTSAGRWDDVWRHPGRGVRAVIDLDAIASNVRLLKEHLAQGSQFMAVVKANAYGHGAVGVALAALDAGADLLGVATVGEGRTLRDHGIDARIVVLGPADVSEYGAARALGLELGVGSMRGLHAIAALGSSAAGEIPIHLKIDSGMRRFGLLPDELDEAIAVIAAAGVRLTGVYSHFARADEDDPAPTQRQAGVFAEACAKLIAAGCVPSAIHQANSAASLRVPGVHGQICRVGIALYGLRPSAEVELLPDMRPALSLIGRVQREVRMTEGDGVSYGHTYIASGQESACLLPLGYGDGYPRSLSNRGWVGLGPRRLQVRGRVCMDQTVVGDTKGEPIPEGATVEILGGDHGPSADDLALLTGSINYEIVTALSHRIPRYYIRSGCVVSIDDERGYRPVE